MFGHVDKKFNPELTKYPLFRLNAGEAFVNPHHIWPYDGNFKSSCYIGILHFKFLPGVMARIQEAIDRQSYWNGSQEYRCYLKALAQKPNLTCYGKSSRRYVNVSSLIEHGIVSEIDWNMPAFAASDGWR